MALVGLIPEPPLDPRSWSGSSKPLFEALHRRGLLVEAREVKLSPSSERWHKARCFSPSLKRWKERYHGSVPRFQALTDICLKNVPCSWSGNLQIGAWFNSYPYVLPGFSYHDGNAAERYRHYGQGLLANTERQQHLEWERSVYESMTGIFVMSDWLATSFIRDFGIPSSKLHVVYAGINLERIPQVPTRTFEKPRFLFVGKDFERKGGKYLLQAFAKMRREIPSAELVIVGPVKLDIHEPGVMCAGHLSKADASQQRKLEDLFASATAMILPSIYEPFGISLAEGMMYGLPCVAVNRCAMPEIVQDGKTGLIARAEDSDDLARAMLELARDPARCAAFGRAGSERAERDFTWDAVAAKIETIVTRHGVRPFPSSWRPKLMARATADAAV